MTAAEIAATLGDAHRSGDWWRCPCPVHGSRGATLALRDGDHGLILCCYAGCRPAAIFAELCRRGLIGNGTDGGDVNPDPAMAARRREAEARDRHRRIALARDIIDVSLPAAGTPVQRYLRKRIPGLRELPPVLRYLPMADIYARHSSGSRRPVMVATVEHVDYGVVGAHRTWLALDGSAKASIDPVRISTGPIKGGAVRLAPAAETLMVAEGIETALSGMAATAMPAWAALSTSGIMALELPQIVRTLVLLADHDRSGAGERAARTAAARWLAEGRRVRIAMPPEPGTDFNDVLLGRTYAEVRHVAA
jgi:putative DNA primase/helicase